MINTLKKRGEFIDLRNEGASVVTKGLVLQYKKIDGKDSSAANIGFTASKKIGGAVYRNRCRRMMKECVKLTLRTNPELFKDNYNYNLIARFSTIKRSFEDLLKDLKYALHQANKS